MRYAGGREIAFDGGQYFAGKVGAEFIVGVAHEPGAKVFIRLASDHVLAEQALDSFGNERRGAAIADWTRNGSMLADRSAKAEIVGVGELAFHANVGDPMLATAVGAAGDVKAKLLIELRQALFKLVDKPAREAFGFGD